jgi:hypothetical protein
VKYLPDNTIYQKINKGNISLINDAQLVEHKPLTSSLIFSDSRPAPFVNAAEDPFFSRQHKIVLKDCGE